MIEKENITKAVVERDLCTGCGLCIAVCPENALSLYLDERTGTYVPIADNSLCNQCGICLRVCPGAELKFNKMNMDVFGKLPENREIGNYISCYIGYSNNHDLRYHSSSGGLMTQLLIYLLNDKIVDGVLVTRMSRTEPLRPEPFIARTEQEVIEASGSKYCPVPANIAVKEILGSEDDEKFAFVGLPCHIHGMRKAEEVFPKLRQKIVIYMGLFCGQGPSFFATERLLSGKHIDNNNIQNLNYRGEGWFGGMTVHQKDGTKKYIDFFDYWGRGFGQYFYPRRCTLCYDGVAEFADISFGDASLPEIRKNDNIGSSIIVSKSENGEKVLQDLLDSGSVTLTKTSPEKVIESQKDMLAFKKRYFYARRTIQKSLGNELPEYQGIDAKKPILNEYIRATLLYFTLWMSLNGYYPVLASYISLKKSITKPVCKLIKR